MHRLIIDGTKISNIEELHDFLSKTLKFPDYYGNNLDALWDMLTEMDEILLMSVINVEDLEEALEDKFDPFMEVLSDADNELENIFVRFDSFYLSDFCNSKYTEDMEYNIIHHKDDILRFRFLEMGVIIEETTFSGDELNELANYLIMMFPWAENIISKGEITAKSVIKSDYKIYEVKE